MKRFLFVLSVLLLIAAILPSISLADGLDLSSLSLEDLLGLRKAIDEEIHIRISQPSETLYDGVYVIGTDIRSGRYLVTVIDCCVDEYSDSASFRITSVNGEKDRFYLVPGQSRIVELVDGTTFEVEDVLSATLSDVPPASYAP